MLRNILTIAAGVVVAQITVTVLQFALYFVLR
jgi:hypothetical protein